VTILLRFKPVEGRFLLGFFYMVSPPSQGVPSEAGFNDETQQASQGKRGGAAKPKAPRTASPCLPRFHPVKPPGQPSQKEKRMAPLSLPCTYSIPFSLLLSRVH
jgi:hypothetical protein